jgi:DNA-binding transcriptional LysR family regulator
MADHAGAELADHVERLLGEIEALVADAHQQARHLESD